MALHDAGTVAVLLNRRGTLGPAEGYRSRGQLPLLALTHPTAAEAIRHMRHRDLTSWRPFNLLVADTLGGWWLEHEGEGQTRVTPLREGRWVLHAGPANDPGSARTAGALPALRKARHPRPDDPDSWNDLLDLLGRKAPPKDSPLSGVFVRTPVGFGTVSTSLLAVAREAKAVGHRWAYGVQTGTTFTPEFSEVLPQVRFSGDGSDAPDASGAIDA